MNVFIYFFKKLYTFHVVIKFETYFLEACKCQKILISSNSFKFSGSYFVTIYAQVHFEFFHSRDCRYEFKKSESYYLL